MSKCPPHAESLHVSERFRGWAIGVVLRALNASEGWMTPSEIGFSRGLTAAAEPKAAAVAGEALTTALSWLDLSASAGSRVIVVTANAWSSEQSYVSVVQTNVDMYRGIIPHLARLSPEAVMIIASQPGWCRRVGTD